MRKIIEFFKWDYEGDYQQYFYVIEEDTEESFIKEILVYLNTIKINDEFFWARCLENFKTEQQVELYLDGYIEHLNSYYYIQDSDKSFELEKYTSSSITTKV